ncbi:MAG: hypothetical protein AAGA72_07245 [Pseudomonadota bacterium]
MRYFNSTIILCLLSFGAVAETYNTVLENSEAELRLSYACQAALVGDVVSVGQYAEDPGSDLGTFCRCFASVTALVPERVEARASVLNAIIDLRQKDAIPFFDTAAAVLHEMIERREVDGVSLADWHVVMTELSETTTRVWDNNGQCPVS